MFLRVDIVGPVALCNEAESSAAAAVRPPTSIDSPTDRRLSFAAYEPYTTMVVAGSSAEAAVVPKWINDIGGGMTDFDMSDRRNQIGW